ncbi:MAG: oligosaccharide flippase family protein [Prevotellaceae bacterium]|jgi:O-antigen/teichoic acid export membrane protein|nr:oligosaccharide flippase family protein [Prevotellaceae bacterium]
MSNGVKSLAKDTAIYGVSSILGRFLNWLLVPLYSYTITTGEYGVVGLLYSWIALIITILTYGMETGYFRFATTQPNETAADRVYTTTLTSIASTSILFVIVFAFFYPQISVLMMLPDYSELVMVMAVTVAIDAFSTIPFAYLRLKHKPVKFMSIKILMIVCNVLFNVFFLIICPKIYNNNPDLISWFFNPEHKVRYIIISNFLSTFVGFVVLLPLIFAAKWKFDFKILKTMLRYSLPLLLFGIVGTMNQTVDRLIFPHVYHPDAKEVWQGELGVYQACFKVAMVMMMFQYAFRFAYEPFIFAKKENKDSKSTHSLTMTYFVITSMLIYLVLIAGLDALKLLLDTDFRVGIAIIPFVLITYFFQGVYYNLSLWYKLTDKTMWGTWISLIGLALSLILNIIFIPKFSYWACVFSSLITFFITMIICYFLGQKYYPIKYNLKKIGLYFFVAIVLSLLMLCVKMPNLFLTIVWRVALLVPFVAYIVKKDVPLLELPFVKRILRH